MAMIGVISVMASVSLGTPKVDDVTARIETLSKALDDVREPESPEGAAKPVASSS